MIDALRFLFRPEDRPRYCTTCGARQVFRDEPRGFNHWTGKPIFDRKWACPLDPGHVELFLIGG